VDSDRLGIAARRPLDKLAKVALRLLQLPFTVHDDPLNFWRLILTSLGRI